MNRPSALFKILRGLIVAVTTPFNKDLSLDLGGMRALVDFYCQERVGPLIIGGSTGEFHALTIAERQRIVEVAVEQARGRLPIIAGCAHSGTQIALDLVRHAARAGAVGAMVTPPYYGFAGLEGLRRHYQIINDGCGLGVLVYFSTPVVPMVQDIIANPALFETLARIPNIVGLKDSTGNYGFYRDMSLRFKNRVAVIGSGGMGCYLWGVDFGSPGVLTGLGNIWPREEMNFMDALRRGRRAQALRFVIEKDRPYLDAWRAVGGRFYFAMVKALLDMVGLPGGPMRPPLLDWPKEKKPMLRAAMERIGLLAPRRRRPKRGRAR
ncbi:MAG: dihydrodipicolinate synthase family protein [Lentisphaerae bacterium]|nr:dihydrodipicolinate synthase family protein [Lentisphaerota bacterium]